MIDVNLTVDERIELDIKQGWVSEFGKKYTPGQEIALSRKEDSNADKIAYLAYINKIVTEYNGVV